jgi:hypothetical protein
MAVWVELSDGSKEWLSDYDVHALCAALWQSQANGAASLLRELLDARTVPSALRHPISALTAAEEDAFRDALQVVRQPR